MLENMIQNHPLKVIRGINLDKNAGIDSTIFSG